MWYKHDGWNQKFNLYSDKTIRIAGKCVDLNRNNRNNGEKIQLWDCNGGTSQRWVYDTGGHLRLYDNTGFCIDNNYGSAGTTLYLWQCGSNTELFRSSKFDMRIYSRQCSLNPFNFDIGHAFVSITKYDDYNNIASLTTYSLWPNEDLDDQNTLYAEANDRKKRGSGDNVNVNQLSKLFSYLLAFKKNKFSKSNFGYTCYNLSLYGFNN